MDTISELHSLCEAVSREIAEANEKIRAAGGKMAVSDVDYLDKLTHTLKSIKATIAMMEDEGHGSSGRRYPYRASAHMRREPMGYPRTYHLSDQLYRLMDEAPNDQIKREIQMLVDRIEQQM